MLLQRRRRRLGRVPSWADVNPVITLADRLDRDIPPQALIAVRKRFCHPFGFSRTGRVVNVVLRLAVPIGAVSAVVLAWGVPVTDVLVFETALVSLGSVLLGLQADAPRLTVAIYRVVDVSIWGLVLVSVPLVGVGFALCLAAPQPGMARVGSLLTAICLLYFTRTLLTVAGPGGMVRRHRRRSVGTFLSQALCLSVGWLIVLAVNTWSLRSADLAERRNALIWTLGLFAVGASYAAAVIIRRQRLYARIITAIDEVLFLLRRRDRGTPVDDEDVTRRLVTLVRLFGASVDSWVIPVGLRFESAGVQLAIQCVAARAFDLGVQPAPSLLAPAPLVSTEVASWSTQASRRYLTTYLVALRGQLRSSEDPLAG